MAARFDFDIPARPERVAHSPGSAPDEGPAPYAAAVVAVVIVLVAWVVLLGSVVRGLADPTPGVPNGKMEREGVAP